jgi:hypothetical protein
MTESEPETPAVADAAEAAARKREKDFTPEETAAAIRRVQEKE